MMPNQARANFRIDLRNRQVKRPELVLLGGETGGERAHRVYEADRRLHNCRLHGEPEEAELRVRAGSPTSSPIRRKPLVSRIMVNMMRPCQSHQHIDVQQRNRHQDPLGSTNSRLATRSSASSAACISSGPKLGVPCGTW